MAGEWLNWQEFQAGVAPQAEEQARMEAERDSVELTRHGQNLQGVEDAALSNGGRPVTSYAAYQDAQNAYKSRAQEMMHRAVAAPGWDTGSTSAPMAAEWGKLAGRLAGAQENVNSRLEQQKAQQRRAADESALRAQREAARAAEMKKKRDAEMARGAEARRYANYSNRIASGQGYLDASQSLGE